MPLTTESFDWDKMARYFDFTARTLAHLRSEINEHDVIEIPPNVQKLIFEIQGELDENW